MFKPIKLVNFLKLIRNYASKNFCFFSFQMATSNLENCVVRLFLAYFSQKMRRYLSFFWCHSENWESDKTYRNESGQFSERCWLFRIRRKNNKSIVIFSSSDFSSRSSTFCIILFSATFLETFSDSPIITLSKFCSLIHARRITFQKIYFHPFKKLKHETSNCSKISFETLPQTTPSFVNQPLANKPKTTQFCG